MKSLYNAVDSLGVKLWEDDVNVNKYNSIFSSKLDYYHLSSQSTCKRKSS